MSAHSLAATLFGVYAAFLVTQAAVQAVAQTVLFVQFRDTTRDPATSFIILSVACVALVQLSIGAAVFIGRRRLATYLSTTSNATDRGATNADFLSIGVCILGLYLAATAISGVAGQVVQTLSTDATVNSAQLISNMVQIVFGAGFILGIRGLRRLWLAAHPMRSEST